MQVPEAYYDFVMAHAPYLYVTPDVGPDLTWGKAVSAASFAIDFLYEAYFDEQFDDRSGEIEDKIADLADWILTQQVTDSESPAYGGFASTESSAIFYSVDACRVLPALLKAYELTSKAGYLNSAKLAASIFLFNMQQKPSQQAIHDRYYGGFARAIDSTGSWQQQMDTESAYGLIGLRMICEVDPANKTMYESMMLDAMNFYRVGIENASLSFNPLPIGDGKWHRTGLGDDTVYDDCLAYALLGLYESEGFSLTVRKTYETLNAIEPSPAYPAYNSAVCWAGYINVESKTPACDYYDCVSAGILSKIRKNHDKIAYDFSAKTVAAHAGKFMFWGAKHANYAPVENKQAMATVCWLGQLLIGYEAPVTRFTQILSAKGEDLTLHPLTDAGEKTAYGKGTPLKAIVLPSKAEEIQLESGFLQSDYLTLHVFASVRRHDKICRNGLAFEVLGVQDFAFKGQVVYRRLNCRRLVVQ
jgi:hypothetical protein